MRVVVAIGVLAAAAARAGSPCADGYASLEIETVTSAGVPVAGATVEADSLDDFDGRPIRAFRGARADYGWPSIQSSPTGKAVLACLRSGRFRVSATHPSFVEAKAEGSSAAVVRIVLPLGDTIDGSVVSTDGEPLPDVWVEIRARKEAPHAEAAPSNRPTGVQTDDAGHFVSPPLRSGRYLLRALDRDGNMTAPVMIEVRHGKAAPAILRFALDAITGLVVNPDGGPAPDVAVSATAKTAERTTRDLDCGAAVRAWRRSERTDALGRFTFLRVPRAGTFDLSAWTERDEALSAAAEGVQPGAGPLRLVLARSAAPGGLASISGRLTGPPGLAVRIESDGSAAYRFAQTPGEFSFPVRGASAITVFFFATAMASQQFTVTAAPGSDVRLPDINFDPERPFRVHVVDALTGATVTDASIILERDLWARAQVPHGPIEPLRRPLGRSLFQGLSAGSVEGTVRAYGYQATHFVSGPKDAEVEVRVVPQPRVSVRLLAADGGVFADTVRLHVTGLEVGDFDAVEGAPMPPMPAGQHLVSRARALSYEGAYARLGDDAGSPRAVFPEWFEARLDGGVVTLTEATRAATLQVRALSVEGSCARTSVHFLLSRGDQPFPDQAGWSMLENTLLAPDRSGHSGFTFVPLRPGTYTLFGLWMPITDSYVGCIPSPLRLWRRTVTLPEGVTTLDPKGLLAGPFVDLQWPSSNKCATMAE